MNSKRLYQTMLTVIVLLVLVLIGGAYVFNSLLHKQSDTIVSAQSQLAVLSGRQDALKTAQTDIKKYKSLAAIASSIVPQDKDQAQTVSEIVKISSQNGVKLGSITFPASSLGSAVGATTPSSTKSALSQLLPVKDISGVYSLQIIIQSDPDASTPFANFLNFLHGLEHNRRTALVTGISITPDNTNPSNIAFTLTLQEYVKP